MMQQLDECIDYNASPEGDWPNKDLSDILVCHFDDPEKALAYVVLAASRTDDADFLCLMGCGPLENVLDDPSSELLDRIVAQARKSPRFCWLLSCPFEVAVAERAWKAIKQFRITGPHEEPPLDALPPREPPV